MSDKPINLGDRRDANRIIDEDEAWERDFSQRQAAQAKHDLAVRIAVAISQRLDPSTAAEIAWDYAEAFYAEGKKRKALTHLEPFPDGAVGLSMRR